MNLDIKDHSEKAYLKRLPVAMVKGLLGSLLQFEQTEKLTEFEKQRKQLYIEVLQELGESADLNIEGSPYFPYVRKNQGFFLID